MSRVVMHSDFAVSHSRCFVAHVVRIAVPQSHEAVHVVVGKYNANRCDVGQPNEAESIVDQKSRVMLPFLPWTRVCLSETTMKLYEERVRSPLRFLAASVSAPGVAAWGSQAPRQPYAGRPPSCFILATLL